MTGNEEGSGVTESAAPLRMHTRTTAFWRAGGIAVLAVTAAAALGACGGPSSGPTAPHVASLGQSSRSRGVSTTTAPTGDATRLLDEWATCMHSNGDPNQAPPTIDSDKTIHIYIPEENDALSNAVHNGTAPCNQYLAAAQKALRDGQPLPEPPSAVQEVKFAECMRANGFPTWPNPSGPNDSETNFRGTGIDPNSPQVKSAGNKCNEQVGITPTYESPLGDAGDIEVMSGPPGGPPPGFAENGGAGSNSGAGAGG